MQAEQPKPYNTMLETADFTDMLIKVHVLDYLGVLSVKLRSFRFQVLFLGTGFQDERDAITDGRKGLQPYGCLGEGGGLNCNTRKS